MAKTTTFSSNNSTFTAITTAIATKSVTVGEDPSVANWPTTDLLIAAPTNADTAIQRSSGTTFTFTCPTAFWKAGTVVGYIKNKTGASTTMQQYEDGF